MDAEPLLGEVARQLHAVRLESVLIGNAAAALQGAPVTTVDFDFFFRKTPRNLAKMKAFARALGATILRPYYPVSDLYRIVRDDDGLQVDLMATIHGVRSFAACVIARRLWRSVARRCSWPRSTTSSQARSQASARSCRPGDAGGCPWRPRSQAARPGSPPSRAKLSAPSAS